MQDATMGGGRGQGARVGCALFATSCGACNYLKNQRLKNSGGEKHEFHTFVSPQNKQEEGGDVSSSPVILSSSRIFSEIMVDIPSLPGGEWPCRCWGRGDVGAGGGEGGGVAWEAQIPGPRQVQWCGRLVTQRTWRDWERAQSER